MLTSSISIICFGSSFIGSGQLWGWLQNIVGVSNQIAWLSIGLASWRFRKAWIRQGRSLDELKFRPAWTWPWGPPFVIITVTALILIQGWSSIFPTFSVVDFFSLYIEIPVMVVMYLVWLTLRHRSSTKTAAETEAPARALRWSDIVDTKTVDLSTDEYVEHPVEDAEAERQTILRRLYYWFA